MTTAVPLIRYERIMQIGRYTTALICAGVLAAGGWGASAFAGTRDDRPGRGKRAAHPVHTATTATPPVTSTGCPPGFTYGSLPVNGYVLWACASKTTPPATVTVTMTQPCPATDTTTTTTAPTVSSSPAGGPPPVTATYVITYGGSCMTTSTTLTRR